jgi:EAL domain-containing protein (putative c-di-GMP-specific phosphodiesterase class I)/GGDEF domain-containing protein
MIISFVFLLIFVGNTIITINNTKDYLEEESITKAKDTATSLGMILKLLISNKKDPEIVSTINAISDSGFYSQIRLEDAFYTFSDEDLLSKFITINGLKWNVLHVDIDKKFGELIINTDNSLEKELDQLEDIDIDEHVNTNLSDHIYTFLPSKNFTNNDILKLVVTIKKKNKIIKKIINLKLSKILVQTIRKVKFDDVPQWFIDFISINLKEQSSLINDGWKNTAIIYVQANPGVAYFKLYEQVKDTIIYSIFAFLIALLILYIFLRFILKPLKDIEILANEISKGNYLVIEKLPWTKELKNVSLSMNTMSNKIKNIIERLNQNIQDVSEKLSKDQLTSLETKQSFEEDLKNKFVSNQHGYVFIAQISELGSFAKVNGRNSVNNFLIEFANILKSIKYVKAYRFYGSEFALITSNIDYAQCKNLAIELKKELEKLSLKINKVNIANIGAVPFTNLDTFGSVMSGASEAYEMAKQIGPNEVFIRKENNKSRGMLEWKRLVFDIIDNNKIDLDYIGDIKDLNDNLILQEAFSKMKDNQNNNLPIGIFLSVAEENGKIVDFDKIIIQKVIDYIYKNNIKHKISINLSIDSIKNIEFLSWLNTILDLNKDISNQIIFSLTAYNIAKYLKLFKEFTGIVKSKNTQVMIKRFDIKFIKIDQIKDIHPDCIRLARDYTTNISEDINKKSLVDSICKISELIDIKIYAESVTSENDFRLLKSFGLDGISRK